jgi:NADPH:quinone reductase-like Zn-dependent oxidoreductase
MKAVRIYSYGDSNELKLEELSLPQIKNTEVLVKIHAAGVNPVDWKIRAGFLKEEMPVTFPLTMGQDFSGEIVKVGQDVPGFTVGDRVFGFARGSYAEFAAIPFEDVTAIPHSVDYVTAAAIPTAGLTAWEIVHDVLKLEKGKVVLIHGAAGGVGSFAVQLARIKNAHVIATASREDADYLLYLGAMRVIDYKTKRFEEYVEDVDAVIDLVGGDTLERSYQVVKKGGTLVSTAAAIDHARTLKLGIRGIDFLMKHDDRGLAQVARLIEQGRLRPRVSQVLSLEEARVAQELLEKGHPHGKVVLQIM